MDERRPPYGFAFCLLVAGVLPVLSRDAEGNLHYAFFEPPPLIAAAVPDLASVATYCPAAAGGLVFVMGAILPRALWALGCVIAGTALPAVLLWRTNPVVASNGLLAVDGPWDWLILGGLAVSFVAARAQAVSRPWLPLAVLCGLGGGAVLVWLLFPRPPSGCDQWLGLITQLNAPDVPIVRGAVRNQEFPDGTRFIWYVWWNVYLLALVASPLLCLRVAARPRDFRPATAGDAYGALLLVVFALLLMPVVQEVFDVRLQPPPGNPAPAGSVQALLNAANKVREVFPPLLLPVLALIGLSELITLGVPSRRTVTV